MRITTALASLTAALALVAGSTTPAGAATQDRADPAGDTTRRSDAAPSRTIRDAADIVTLRGRHGDGRLVFTVTVADLVAPDATNYVSVVARFVTPTGAEYGAVLEAAGGEKFVGLINNTADREVECDGLEGRVLAARDQYVLSVPRSCVRNPREVRFGAAVRFTGEDPGATRRTRGGTPIRTSAEDDARRDGTTGNVIRLGTRALANN